MYSEMEKENIEHRKNNKVNVITNVAVNIRRNRFIVRFFNQSPGTVNKTSMRVISQKDENVKELNDEEMEELLSIDGIKFHHPLRSWVSFKNKKCETTKEITNFNNCKS
ncbi:unnamed protein product [Rhizophagus irregularis]|nr:unnamed protein product [Rhizophagus irregularis]